MAECPPATQDIVINLDNRKKAIDQAMYGPLNPGEPNEEYWTALGQEWNVSAEEAKKQRCGNCAVFIQTPSMMDCIESGLTDNADEFDAIDEAGELGYCEIFDFKCASARTCRAWVAGGPVTEEEEPVVAAGSDPKTPAPKKDRIKGSKTNPKGSASTGKSSKVNFSAKTETALKNKVKEHNEKASEGRRATLGMLKAVYRRGAGAFSTSHRPGKTRDQWAMARVNAYLKLLRSGRPANAAYTTDNDLLPASHPRSTKKSNSALVSGAALIPEERDLAEAILEVVQKHGKFNEDQTGVWAGYSPAAENEVKGIGVTCANCVFYLGGDQCQIISLPVEPEGKCRFAVIPEGKVDKNAIEDYMMQQEEETSYAVYKDELTATVFDSVEDYYSTEHALTTLSEISDFSYDAHFALRAAWIRAVKEGDDPYSRARNLAELGYASLDADLLPITEKGASS